MPSTVYLVTGGARSGKSRYAQALCESLSTKPIYLATSKVWDEDFKDRIQKHKDDRGEQWQTIEEQLYPSKHCGEFSGRSVLVDCLTLWLTNFFSDEDALTEASSEPGGDAKLGSGGLDAPEKALERAKKEFDNLINQWDATFVFVTNEIGSGTHATDHLTRKFVDAQGWFNQHVAKRSTRVIHVVCGIPNVIKDIPPVNDDSRNPLRLPNKQKIDEAKMLNSILSTRAITMDSKGYFLIKVDRERVQLRATFHSCIVNERGEVCDMDGNKIRCCDGNRPEPMEIFEGRTAKEITIRIFEQWEHSSIISTSHAAYIGREVQKAEDALYSGKFYQQD